MLKRICIIVASVLFCVALLQSCTDKSADIEYISEEVPYSEPNVGRLFYADMETVTIGKTAYYFEKAVPAEVRAGCIEMTNAVTEILALEKSLNIYIYTENKLADTFIGGGSVYTSVQDWRTPEFTAKLLMGVFGEYCNYGAVYGYAQYICNEIGIDVTEHIDDAKFTEVQEAYDLTLLCFNEHFTSQESIDASKAIAADFVADYITANGIQSLHQLIQDSGSLNEYKSFNNALEEYYKAHGVEHVQTNMLYSFGGQSYDYIVQNEYATFCIEKDWQDLDAAVNPLMYSNFLHENYSDIKQFFEINTQQMAAYQELFDLDEYDNSLGIIFTNRNNGYQYSFYRPEEHVIYIKNIASLMHEYIHSLTIDSSISDQWATEGFARYFSYKYDYYGIAFLNEDYNNTQDIPETQYVREYLAEIRRPIDMAVDFTEVEAIAVYSRNLYDPNGSYVAGSSFVAYLVNNFGEDAVINYVCQKENPLAEQNYSELVAQWKDHIEQKYSQYSKYE